MQIDPTQHPGPQSYQLLTSLVVPRPIAWVTSLGETGVLNLAPFSFFNAVSGDPPYVALSVGRRDDGGPKDTGRNIESKGEFVVNLVTEELMRAMHISAADFPPDESEVAAAGLHAAPSVRLAVPRLAEARASLECTLFKTVPLGGNTLYIGQVVMLHVADDLVGPRLRITGFAPIGRLGVPSLYSRTVDRFELPRLSYAEAVRGKS
jgi:flavin reductase (DIM6/NTAB) family NADH-FMN oxidoreductase RutF